MNNFLKRLLPLSLSIIVIYFSFFLASCKSKECEHSYSETTTKYATCSENGNKTYTCNKCGDSYSKEYELETLTANEIYELSKNSVAEITTYDKNGDELSLGTGVVYKNNGSIITNYHVIEDAYSIKINLNNSTYNVQSVLAYDKTIDLAVLKVNAENLKELPICLKEHTVGTTVYALGSSQGLTETFSQGIITCSTREIDDINYIQHDAAISSGNSGGPLINHYGEFIGINTMTMKDSQNLNFAISAKEFSKLAYGESLTVKEFYEKECDTFTKVKNFIISKGSYDYSDKTYTLTLGYTYSADYSSKYTRKAIYYVEDNQLCLMLFINADTLVSIFIDEINSIYTWSYLDTSNYYMRGTLYAATFDSNTLLGYSYNNISSSSLRSTVRELASAMVNYLLVCLDADFEDINITAEDLGFLCY